MTARDLLWELIHSLNFAEKQRFKNRVYERTRGGNNQKAELFDAIQRQKDGYDEAKLKRKFRNHPLGKRFAVTKFELYEFILHHVPDVDADSGTTLAAHIAQCKFLLKKGLYAHLPKLLQEARELAERTDAFSDQLELLDVLREEARRRRNSRSLQEVISHIHPIERQLLAQFVNLKEYNLLLDIAHSLGGMPPEKRRREIARLLKVPMVKSSDSCLSTSAEIYFEWIHYNIHIAQGHYGEAIERLKNVLTRFEARPELLEDQGRFTIFVFAKSNLGLLETHSGNFDKARSIVAELQNLRIPGRDEKLLIVERLTKLKATIIVYELEPTKSLEEAKHIAETASKYGPKLDSRLQVELSYLMSRYFLIADLPNQAIEWASKAIDLQKSKVRLDVSLVCRFHQIIANIEQANLDEIEALTRTLKKALSSDGQLGEIESAFLGFVRRYLEVRTDRELADAYQEIESKIESIKSINTNTAIGEFSNFLSCWVRSKVAGKPLSAVIRELRD